MKLRLAATATLLLATLSCGDATGPGSCGPNTGSVNVTVSTGGAVTFDWAPACALAMLIVEEEGSDMWWVAGFHESSGEDPTPADNRILPRVTYGVNPAGTVESSGPVPLQAGHTYGVALWRVLEPGSTANCLSRFGDACLVAAREFTR